MIAYIVVSYHDTLNSLQNSFRDAQLPFRLAAINCLYVTLRKMMILLIKYGLKEHDSNRQTVRQSVLSTMARVGGFRKF